MKPIYIRFRNARRERGMSQIELANAVECMQSAISMMESGRADALSRDRLLAIARVLGVEMEDGEPGDVWQSEKRILRICPIADCPSNMPYMVSGQLMFLPKCVEAAAGAAIRCVFCGEILEATCSTCGAGIRAGACCSVCGNAYVSADGIVGQKDPVAWATMQVQNVLRIRGMFAEAAHLRD